MYVYRYLQRKEEVNVFSQRRKILLMLNKKRNTQVDFTYKCEMQPSSEIVVHNGGLGIAKIT